jgi:hypothetical protein
MPDEEVVYQAHDIEISKTLARFKGVTYPINGIGSVRVEKPNRTSGIVIGLILCIIGIIVFAEGKPGELNWVAIAVAVVGALIVMGAINRPYRLMLRTASGDQQAYETTNKGELLKIKEGIERAVVLRG